MNTSSQPSLSPTRRILVFGFSEKSDVVDNVSNFFRALRKDMGEKQLVYHLPVLGATADKVLPRAYRILIDTYNRDDSICILGAGQGARTASAFDKMIARIGVLDSTSKHMLDFALKIVASDKLDDLTESVKLRMTFSTSIPVSFVGLWPGKQELVWPAPSDSGFARVIRTALALDPARDQVPRYTHRPIKLHPSKEPPNISELWFAGSETDVCGKMTGDAFNQAMDSSTPGLWRIPLIWMIQQAQLSGLDLALDYPVLTRLCRNPTQLTEGISAEHFVQRLQTNEDALSEMRSPPSRTGLRSRFSWLSFSWRDALKPPSRSSQPLKVSNDYTLHVHESVSRRMGHLEGYQPSIFNESGEDIFATKKVVLPSISEEDTLRGSLREPTPVSSNTHRQHDTQSQPPRTPTPLSEDVNRLRVKCRGIRYYRGVAESLVSQAHWLAGHRIPDDTRAFFAIRGFVVLLDELLTTFSTQNTFVVLIEKAGMLKEAMSLATRMEDFSRALDSKRLTNPPVIRARMQQKWDEDERTLFAQIHQAPRAEEMADVLQEIGSDNDALETALSALQDLLRTLMSKGRKEESEAEVKLVQGYLLQITEHSLVSLPSMHLRNPVEIRKAQDRPHAATNTFDIYEGILLGRRQCRIKALRSLRSGESAVHDAFKKVTPTWKDLRMKDRDEHLVPYFGFCDSDGPFPYVITAWMSRGDALMYAKEDITCDHRKLILDIANCLAWLHAQGQLHGYLRSENILIDKDGRPRLADTGLTQIIVDASKEPFSDSASVADAVRWLAPEVYFSPNTPSQKSDIYSFAMTVLELMTHKPPFSSHKKNTSVITALYEGESPKQPALDETLIQRGLDDNLWKLLEHCWLKESDRRPGIDNIVDALREVHA